MQLIPFLSNELINTKLRDELLNTMKYSSLLVHTLFTKISISSLFVIKMFSERLARLAAFSAIVTAPSWQLTLPPHFPQPAPPQRESQGSPLPSHTCNSMTHQYSATDIIVVLQNDIQKKNPITPAFKLVQIYARILILGHHFQYFLSQNYELIIQYYINSIGTFLYHIAIETAKVSQTADIIRRVVQAWGLTAAKGGS